MTNKLTALAVAAAITSVVPIAAHSGPFDDALVAMQENSWGKLNTNAFSDVWAPPGSRPLPGTGDPSTVVSAWSSMAWDSNRGDLIFWGGGHANYPGNEVYRWRSSDLQWERASLPSQVVNFGGNNWEAAGGVTDAPISAHTYDNSEYLPVIDRFVTFGGGAWNTGSAFQDFQNGGVRTGPYLWDPSKANANQVGGSTGTGVDPTTPGGQMWQNRQTLPNCPHPTGGKRIGCGTGAWLEGTSAYTKENGKDVLYVNDGQGGDLWKYTFNDVNDPSQDTIQLVGQQFNSFSGQGAGAFDPTRNLFVRTAQDYLTFWDVTAQSFRTLNVRFRPTDATGEFEDPTFGFRFYGIEYDGERDRFLLWDGDGEIWALNIPNVLSDTGWTVDKIVTASADTPMQADGSPFRGVLGKWKYVAEYDIFLGMLDPLNGDIWAYKPDGWSPTALTVSQPPPSAVSEPGAIGFAMLLMLIGLQTVRRPQSRQLSDA